MNKTYKMVLLDADDTLFDYPKAELNALQLTLAAFEIPYSQELHRLYAEINSGLWAALERGEVDKDVLKVERFRRLFETLNYSCDAAAFSDFYLERLGEGTYLIPGAEALCAYLSEKYKLVIITNGIQSVQMPRIQNSLIDGYISHIVVSEEAKYSKPDSRIFDYAATLADFYDKDQMIIVGDSLTSDIQGGVLYGIDTCWYNLKNIENTSGFEPTYTIYQLEDLKLIL